ncbi:MAG: PLP-dependent decarboxylase [Proteobacteria bacterium]|nr:MAG: PLP-dependent decarboxylase [Pseudomonadota bacterium]
MSIPAQNLTDAYARAGGSFYAYDLDAMGAHLSSLKAEGLRLWYACKANPLSAVLECVKESGFSFDVASLGELEQVLKIGADPKRILLTGPVKSDAFLLRAFAAGTEWFVAESHAQLHRLEKYAAAAGRPVNILLRLQLDWDSGAKSVLGGNKITAFGLGVEDWGNLPALAHLRYRGVHVFQWGNVLSAATLGEVWKRIAEVARQYSDAQGFALDVLDLGGGIGISYEEPGGMLEWESLLEPLAEARRVAGAGELWMELGRYAVGPFGTYVTKVMEKKNVRGESFLLCNGGSQHMVRPALVKESFPCRNLNSARSRPAKKFHVHGPLCTALDCLGSFSLPEDSAEEDLLAFSQCGAYGFTESMPYFLCHELAGEWAWQNGNWRELRKVEAAGSWLR